MMLNSLKDFTETRIGTKVLAERPTLASGAVDWEEFDILRKDSPIYIDHEQDMISFKVMTKPASEGGAGGQWTDMIEVGLHMLKYFNAKYPCSENESTIIYLEAALADQHKRTADRIERNVEGRDVK